MMSWIGAEDAAQGMIRALEAGKNGERYILSSERMSMRQMLDRIALLTGRSPARAWTSSALRMVSKLTGAVSSPLGNRPLLAPDEARFLADGLKVDGAWARGEIGVKYTPIASLLPGVVQSYQRAMDRFAS